MNEEDQKYAVASKSAYQMFGQEPRDERITRTQAMFDSFLPNSGYKIDESLTNSRRTVFKNDDSKDVIIAHRGTKVSKNDLKDLKADGKIFFNKHEDSKRFQKAVDRDHQDIKNFKKNGFSVTLTGHSLGATTAMLSSRANKTKSVLYNAGGSASGDAGFETGKFLSNSTIGGVLGAVILPSGFQVKDKLGMLNKLEKKQKKNIRHYYTTADPVSITSRKLPAKQIRINRKKGLDPHTIDNFIFV